MFVCTQSAIIPKSNGGGNPTGLSLREPAPCWGFDGNALVSHVVDLQPKFLRDQTYLIIAAHPPKIFGWQSIQ